MQKLGIAARRLLIALCLIAILFGIFSNYSYFFGRTVRGQILKVERVTQPTALIGGANSQVLYSFAVAIKEPNGEIVTSSSEDRQWAVAEKGMCVESLFYRYPPWNLEKGGTFFNARLDRLMECDSAKAKELGLSMFAKAAPENSQAPAQPAAPAAAPVGAPANAPSETAASAPAATP